MSPRFRPLQPLPLRFPRVSGDEPDPSEAGIPAFSFSPRERG